MFMLSLLHRYGTNEKTQLIMRHYHNFENAIHKTKEFSLYTISLSFSTFLHRPSSRPPGGLTVHAFR